jgi:ABC-type multidrug transport system ATPase subunit
MLLVQNIHLKYDRIVLEAIHFSIQPGEIIGIAGKSGAGKSSLLKILGGLLDATLGEVFLEGKRVMGPSVKLIPGHSDIQVVNQDFQLDIYHTVEENIREKILYLPVKERNQFVDELLDLIELTEWRNHQAITLSGGEQQRLAIARALAGEPKVLLLDEPFVHLDSRLRSKLISYLLDLRSIRQTSIVLVSHDGSEMLGLCDAIFAMKNGRITRKSKPLSFYYKPKSIEEGWLFGVLNVAVVNGKRILFRPDEYQIVPNDTRLHLDEIGENIVLVAFQNSLFTGPLYENHFLTVNKEKIVLYSLNSLDYVDKIEIKKHKLPTANRNSKTV